MVVISHLVQDRQAGSQAARQPGRQKGREGVPKCCALGRSFFDAVDRDGDGTLTRSELAEAFRRLDVDVSDTDMDKVLASIDIDGGGNLDYIELRRWLTNRGHEMEENGLYEGCTIRVDGLGSDLSEHHALVEVFSCFGEIVACDVVVPDQHEADHTAWALVTFALSQAADLAKMFSADMPPVASMPSAALESMTTHLPDGPLKLEGFLELLATSSWLHIRGLNRKQACHTEGRLAQVVQRHEQHLQSDADEKVQAEVHPRHKDPIHVPAYNILRTKSRGGAKGTMLEHRPPYAAFPQEARERETRRLEQRIQEREETVKLLREWGQGTPAEIEAEVEANQRENAADMQMVRKMAESAKGDEQAVWTMAISKVRSMARERRQLEYAGSKHSSSASVTNGGPSSAVSHISGFSLLHMQNQHDKARRAKARKQKRAELEARRLAVDMKLNIARGKTPSTQRTVQVSEEQDKELQRLVKLQAAKRLQKQQASLVAASAEDSDEESQSERLRLPTIAPERVVPQVLDRWSARLPRAAVANMPPIRSEPLTPGTQKRLRFLDWQRAKQAKKSRALDGAGVSPRVVALHKQVDDAKSALAAKDYVRAAALVDAAIEKYPKLQSLYALRARVDSQAGQEPHKAPNSSRHDLLAGALHNAEVAVTIAPANADTHRRRAESQRMLGDGHAIGALKSTDAALLIEPGDARQNREFRKRLAEVKRDRAFRGSTPQESFRAKQSFPTPADTTAVQPIPPSWPEPPRGPRPARAPMASQCNHWDAIGLIDLMKPQDRLRAVILYALRPRSQGYVPGASVEEQEDYEEIIKKLEQTRAASFATVEDDLDFLRASLRRAGVGEDDVTAVLAWARPSNPDDDLRKGDEMGCTDRVVGVLKACCPVPTHEDWSAVLQKLHSHRWLIRVLHKSLASRSATTLWTVDLETWSDFVLESGALQHEATHATLCTESENRRVEIEKEVHITERDAPSEIEFSATQQQGEEQRRRRKEEKKLVLDQQLSAERIYLRAMQDSRDASSLLEALNDDYLVIAGSPPRTPGYATRSRAQGLAEVTLGGGGLGLGCFCAALLRLARESFPTSKRQGLAEQVAALLTLIAEHPIAHRLAENNVGNGGATAHVDKDKIAAKEEELRRQHELLSVSIRGCQHLPSIRAVFDKFHTQLRCIFDVACSELPSAPLAASAGTVADANRPLQQQGLQLKGWLELACRLGLPTGTADEGHTANGSMPSIAESIFRDESEAEGSSLLVRVLGFQGFEAALTRWAVLTDPLRRGFVDNSGNVEPTVSSAATGNSTEHEAQERDRDSEPEPEPDLEEAKIEGPRLDVESLSAWLELCLQQILQRQWRD
eukprot:COSAG02_NODE_4200_length_5632_cov_709.492319_2_plen_1349_part_00